MMKPTRWTRLFSTGLFSTGLFGVGLLAAVLTGCGLKGQLYLPAPDDNAAAATTAPDQTGELKDSEESAEPDKPADGR